MAQASDLNIQAGRDLEVAKIEETARLTRKSKADSVVLESSRCSEAQFLLMVDGGE